MMVVDNRCAIGFSFSGGEASDAAESRLLPDIAGRIKDPAEDSPLHLLMDRACEEGKTRRLAFGRGYSPVVPPKKNWARPWEYNKELYKRRNEAGQMFRRLKGRRRIGARYDKPYIMFSSFLLTAIHSLFFGFSLCEQALAGILPVNKI
jgi:hypothetical protein